MDQGGGPHENEFWAFSNSEMNITNRLEKVDKKNGVICLVSMRPSELWSINCLTSAFFAILCLPQQEI